MSEITVKIQPVRGRLLCTPTSKIEWECVYFDSREGNERLLLTYAFDREQGVLYVDDLAHIIEGG